MILAYQINEEVYLKDKEISFNVNVLFFIYEMKDYYSF